MQGYPVIVRYPLRWGEMDALGHANNARFFTWFESARIALFEQVGIDASVPSGCGPILATTTCDFLKPIRYPADLEIGARVGRIGNTSFLTEYAVHLAGEPQPAARGSGVVVMVNYTHGTKVPIDDALRSALQALGSPG